MNTHQPNFIMLVGLPGSGKSKFIKNTYSNINVHSSDEIRKELFNNVNDQSNNTLVFTTLFNRVVEDLKNNISCIFDATNIHAKHRKSFLQKLSNIKCYKKCIVISTPFEICIEQNNQRERKVPYDVIENMYKSFDIPYYNEGWDEIKLHYNKEEYKILYGNYQDFTNMVRGYDQNNPYHSLSLDDHIKYCGRYILNNNYYSKGYNELYVASQLHDCGKPFCRTEKDGISHYYKHEHVGCYNSLFYNIPLNFDKLTISALILYHMLPYTFNKCKQSTIDKYIKEFNNDKLKEYDFYNKLICLHEADKQSK